MLEIWKQIPGYPKYEVSTLGNVRHVKRKKILRGGIPYNGYRQVHITNEKSPYRLTMKYQTKKGEIKKYYSQKESICVHQLVALTFLGPKPKEYEVNHKNKDRLDNRIDNLEYIPWRDNRGGKPPIEKICPTCRKQFLTPYSFPKKFCSKKCWQDNQWTIVICTNCGEPFKKKKSYIKRMKKNSQYTGKGERNFCSRSCVGQYAGLHYGFGNSNR